MESTVNDKTPSAFQQSVKSEIEQALNQAIAQHSNGHLQVAQALYLAILQVDPAHPDANHNTGILAIQTGQPAASLAYFLAALDADPTRGQYWLSYIDALLKAGQPDEAAQILTLARQQGLEGAEVDALAVQLAIPEQTPLPPLPSASAKTAGSRKNQTKPEKSAKKSAAQKKGKQPSAQEVNELFAVFNKGDLSEAAAYAKQLTEQYPLHGLGWKGLGTAYLQLGLITDALAPLKKAAELLPDDIGALNNLGNVLQDLGLFNEAEINYRQVLRLKPDYAEAHSNLGNNLRNQYRLNEAEASYRRALTLKPDYADALNNLGNTLYAQGKFAEAETCFIRTLQITPDFAEAYSNMGNALRELGRLDEAEAAYRQALNLRPQFIEAHSNLALTLKLLDKIDEALNSCRRALAIQPDFLDAHINMGGILRDAGKLDDAVASFRHALSINPNSAEALSNLGGLLRELGQLDEALIRCQRALEIKPEYAEAHSNLAGVFKELGLLNDAVNSGKRALNINPDYFNAHINLGSALQTQGHFAAAITSFNQALLIKPDFRITKMNLGYAQLSNGQLTEGWQNHEYRTIINGNRFSHFPKWQGEDLSGKSILIWGEQGIGDEIMFASLFSEIIALSDRCVIECAPKLVSLFSRSFPGAQVVAKSSPPHPAAQSITDYQCPAGSLAQWLRPNLKSFPASNSYLKADPARVTYWKARLDELGTEPKIGFCWRSSLKTGERNLHYTPLKQWGPILTRPNVHFINLQYDECSAELSEAQQLFGTRLHTFCEVDMFNDLDETAALIKALDLVISAPTSVYTIASALGVNTWMMTYSMPWFMHNTRYCPWYPTLRIFIRQWNQSWEEVIEHTAQQLQSQPETQNINKIN
jgi:tetratricopeptide (TPR) repeat protein